MKEIESIDEWLKKTEKIKNEAIEKLSEYAALPIKKFSNPNSEKSAGYTRVPPISALGYMSAWYAMQAKKSFLTDTDEFSSSLGFSAGYAYLKSKSQIKAYDRQITPRCMLLRDYASMVYFMLATFNESIEFGEIAQESFRLNNLGLIKDLGSKVSIFCAALVKYRLYQDGSFNEFEKNRNIVDTHHALEVYLNVFTIIQSNFNFGDLDGILDKMMKIHVAEASSRESDREFFDFHDAPWDTIPFEVLYVSELARKHNKHLVYHNDTLIKMQSIYEKNRPSIGYDALATSVKSRLEKVLF